jgi:DNA-binding transcriptional MerR regulator
MINNIKSVFSIKDLENFSGIKAHTIRIWEKRYNVLQPTRTDTNVRLYDLNSLQKLLNITLLHDYGYKISKIATYPEEKIPQMVRDIITDKTAKAHAVSDLKIAMMNFDQDLFFEIYDSLLEKKTFQEIFHQVFIPFMNELGLLWQTDSITPAHEHFISYLIKQKLLINTEKIQVLKPTKTDKVFVLSLPMNEIHELGLMYINYEILLNGYKTIYLGESMPIENLKELKKHYSNITYISYLTVQPNREILDEYISKMHEELLDNETELWFVGRMVQFISIDKLPERVLTFNYISEIIDKIQ